MKRRDFGRVLAAGSIGTVDSRSSNAYPMPIKTLMHVGASGSTTVESLQFNKRHGANNIDGGEPEFIPGKGWDLNTVLEMKERCESQGISLDMFHLPLKGAAAVDGGPLSNILLAKDPERDREIEMVCQMIEVAAKAGIRGLNYNMTILPPDLRTERTPGRGGTTYSSFDYSKWTDTSLFGKVAYGPQTKAGRVTKEVFFERIAYFLERVIPVAAENKVQMACHQPDPPTPPNLRGVDRWDYPVMEGLKRFIEIAENPYHGFNFCVGTVAEGLKDPGKEIFDIVRYFGERKKIFNVHFRNIRGGFNNFQEVWPDEGDIDMYKLAKVFRDVGYQYMLMVDHSPQHPDPAAGRQAYAFQLGYIKALIHAAYSEV